MAADCAALLKNAESNISGAVESATADFKKAAKIAGKVTCKNLLLNFAVVIVLFIASACGFVYLQNYRDGTKIAEEKAVEVLAEEREKLENELASKEEQIKKEAVASYINSDAYRKDSCKFVASNISKLDCINYMYVYISSNDIKKYPAVMDFYNNYLTASHIQYQRFYNKSLE